MTYDYDRHPPNIILSKHITDRMQPAQLLRHMNLCRRLRLHRRTLTFMVFGANPPWLGVLLESLLGSLLGGHHPLAGARQPPLPYRRLVPESLGVQSGQTRLSGIIQSEQYKINTNQ